MKTNNENIFQKNIFRTKVLVIVLPVFIGVLINLFKIRCEKEINNLIEHDIFLVPYCVLIIITVIIIWIILLRNGIRHENQKHEMLSQLIRKTPNMLVVQNNVKFYRLFAKTINNQLKDIKNKSLSELTSLLKIALKIIAETTRDFTYKDGDMICANFMLLINNKSSSSIIKKVMQKVRMEKRIVLYNCGGDINGVLINTNELVYYSDERIKKMPLMLLPISRDYEINNVILSLPGAPTAAYMGWDIVKDTSSIVEKCKHFCLLTQKDINNYFSTEGAHIKSFLSIRIGDNYQPVGILNVDSNKNNILGDEEFYNIYKALIIPLLEVINPVIEEYSRKYFLKLIDDEQ